MSLVVGAGRLCAIHHSPSRSCGNASSRLRDQLAEVFTSLKNGAIEHKDAAELANLAGKMINSAKVQVEYYALRKEAPDIDFLGCGTKATPVPEEEKAEFKSLMAADEFHPSFLDKCLAEGYDVTIGRDKRGNGILCCIRAELKELLDGGLILSGRGKDVLTAIAVCEYKATYLADENGWGEAETRRGGSYSDIG